MARDKELARTLRSDIGKTHLTIQDLENVEQDSMEEEMMLKRILINQKTIMQVLASMNDIDWEIEEGMEHETLLGR